MDNVEKFLRKISYKFPKGYPDVNDPKEKELLFQLVRENLTLSEQDSNLDQAIIKELGEIPEVKGKYSLKPGSLNLNPADIENFKKIYFISPGKGFGYGEIALYWLFQYSGTDSKSNQGDEQPDLLIGGVPVEVKSYPTSRTALGKFKRDNEFRTILSRVFGLKNITSAVEGDERSFASEVNFNLDTIKDAYIDIIKLNDVLADLNTSNYPALANMKKEIDYVLSLSSKKTPEDLAKAVMAKGFSQKLSNKPGNGGYVANIKPKDITDIYFYQLPNNIEDFIKNMSYDEVRKALTTQSAEFSVDFSIFKS
jgi:hypothetical protein